MATKNTETWLMPKMGASYFRFQHYVFVSTINAEGQFSKGRLLGGVYNTWGQHIETRRVLFSELTPMNYSEVKAIFPNVTIS